MLGIILIFVFVLFFILFHMVFKMIYKNKYIIQIRLEKLSATEAKNTDNELNQPIFKRLIGPVLNDITKMVLKITPKEIIRNYEKKVLAAGVPYKRTVKDWINLQVMMLICLPSMTIILGVYKHMDPQILFLLIFGEVLLTLLFPNLTLSRSINARQKQIQNSLPDVLDLLSVSVEAGLAFDGAVAKVIEKSKGPVGEEFGKVLQEMKIGKNKKEALKDMAERVNVDDLTSFVGSIIQADQLGVSIGNVLRIQSKQMRQKRRQRAQEKAMKAPVKMLIPMILFIFPTIFSVLLGPVVIKAIHMFTK